MIGDKSKLRNLKALLYLGLESYGVQSQLPSRYPKNPQYLDMGICDSGIDSLGADYISKTVKWQRLFSNIRIRKSVQYVGK